MVGLLPLCASSVFEPGVVERYPRANALIQMMMERYPHIMAQVAPEITGFVGYQGRRLLSPLSRVRLTRILKYMLDENEFFGPFGIRSMSKYYEDHPFSVNAGGTTQTVRYTAAESDTGMFGGNSNWRGPVWLPVNGLIVRGLLNLYWFYGDDFKVECPTGSGVQMTLFEVSQEITRRLTSLFLKDENGERPVFGGSSKFQSDPHWRDYILFYEYFHGDNGAGLGASHQTGWTGTIARLMDVFGRLSSDTALAVSKSEVLGDMTRESAHGAPVA
jgi:hypothetical protein